MKKWMLVLFAGMFGLTACPSSDDNAPVYESPVWQENIEIVASKDTSISAQIDLFVAANSMDTVVSESGLVYVIQEPGGQIMPTGDDEVVVWYRGYTVDGIIFDQTVSSPVIFQLDQLISGLQEGIGLIGKGGKIWMLVPPSLGYGDDPPSSLSITDSTVLIFETQLADI